MANATKNDKYTEHAAKAAEARAAVLADAESLIEARDSLDDIKASARAGEVVTALDLATAHAAVELAELRVKGAEDRARKAHENAPFVPIIAETVAAILHKTWGIPAYAVEAVPAKREVPCLYIVQEKAAERGYGSLNAGLTAVLRITYSRTQLHRILTWQDYEKALAPYGHVSGGAVTTSDAQTTIKFAGHPLVPFSNVEPDDKHALADIARTVASRYVGGVDAGVKVTSTTTDEDTSIRKFKVLVTVQTDQPDANRAKGLVQAVTRLGRIVEAEQVDDSDGVAVVYGGASVRRFASATVALLIESTTKPYENVLTPKPYEPVVQVIDGEVIVNDAA